jgi:GNAT superfamily N-acetyltransferase
MFTVERFDSRFVEEAAQMVAARVAALRHVVPSVPSRHLDGSEYEAKIKDLPGVVALDNGRFAGFLLALCIDDLRGRKTAYSPEWAHGVPRAAGQRTLCAMYRAAAETWRDENYQAHVFTTLAHDIEAIGTLHWQSFGNIVIDAIRDLSPVPGVKAGGEVKPAGPNDVGEICRLDHLLSDHLRGSTTFLDFPYRDEAFWKKQLSDPQQFFPAAFSEGRAIAYLKFGPVGSGVCHTVRDDKTVAISGAFCEPDHRSGGISKRLLAEGLAWAREQGYERCSVDWESNNIEATAFWTRHFRPVCVSLMRVVG